MIWLSWHNSATPGLERVSNIFSIVLNKLYIFLIDYFSQYLNINYIIFRHGKNKFIAGAGIKGLGLLTGNAGITSLGTNLAGLGLKTKLAAHLFPSQGRK